MLLHVRNFFLLESSSLALEFLAVKCWRRRWHGFSFSILTNFSLNPCFRVGCRFYIIITQEKYDYALWNILSANKLCLNFVENLRSYEREPSLSNVDFWILMIYFTTVCYDNITQLRLFLRCRAFYKFSSKKTMTSVTSIGTKTYKYGNEYCEWHLLQTN